MKKKLIIGFLILLITFQFISAIHVEVAEQVENKVMFIELKNPVVFNLSLTNNGPTDKIHFYNLLGFQMTPEEKITINSKETKNIALTIYPKENFEIKDYYIFQYYIKSQDNSEIMKKVVFKIAELKDAFEIGSTEVDPESETISVYIHNKENFQFEKIKAEFSSPFFNFNEEFSLNPYQRKNFEIKLNSEDFEKLMAGYYTLTADLEIENKKSQVQGTIKFIEKNIVTTSKKDYGFFINTKTITKINEGNIVADSTTSIQKNIISRLFTTLTPEPDLVERKGFTIDYFWNKKINPGEKLEIQVKTNWLFPFLLIFFVLVIVIFTKKYSETDLKLDKRVTFVKTKGGEFALKVSIITTARNYIERVNIRDRLPPMMKIHERFGGEKPVRADEKARIVEWEIQSLEKGEKRVLSYVIYSKVGVLGKFALPSATAIYDKSGKIKEAFSNRAFFVAEQRSKDLEE